MLTRGALQKCPELAGGGGGGVQYDILDILNFVGVYSNNCGTNIRHYSVLKTIAVSNIKYSERLKK
jgi:CO dehydrogenase/acetyl-CoA synthase epsilon subunit